MPPQCLTSRVEVGSSDSSDSAWCTDESKHNMLLQIPLCILIEIEVTTVGEKFFRNQRKEAICAVLHLHLHESKKLAEMRDCCVSVCLRPCLWDAGAWR